MISTSVSGAKPFLKWVGGKGKLLPQLQALFPIACQNYFEPFVGGGAVFFGTDNSGLSYINDINSDLMQSYTDIKSHVDTLIFELRDLERHYLALTPDARQMYFYERRDEYNTSASGLRRTVLFMFLNKTCFNGLYRQNSKGGFNVPFGRYAKPTICNEVNLRAVSQKLQNTTILNGSYRDAVSSAKQGDFIYFDPPYHPLNETSSFTAYHADGFTAENQAELRDLFVELDARGCYVMLSNSSAPLIKELYKDYRQEEILAARSINSKAAGRGKIAEVVILNY